MSRILILFLSLASFCWTFEARASDFNLPFVNSSGLGVAYADWATALNDASVAYTNPAGLVYLPKPQFVFNALGILGSAQFNGSSLTPPYPFPFPVAETGSARTPIGAFMPSLYLSSPITERLSVGFNVTSPFGLGTNYGNSSIVRYVSTESKVLGIDISPSLGFKLSDYISVGAGLDALHLAFTLNSMFGPPVSFQDISLENSLSGWGYGWHGGVLFHLQPRTRIGLSYNSRISASTLGTSAVIFSSGTEIKVNNQETKAALPARAQLSVQHDFTDKWTGMATVFYTNWKTFDKIVMKNTLAPNGTTLPVTIPFNYGNTFDYAFGATYQATNKWLLRGGVQLLATPSNDQDRGVADPIGSAVIVSAGAQFLLNDAFKFDFGVGHSFFKREPVNLTTPLSSLSGRNKTQTTVVGGQVTWTMA